MEDFFRRLSIVLPVRPFFFGDPPALPHSGVAVFAIGGLVRGKVFFLRSLGTSFFGPAEGTPFCRSNQWVFLSCSFPALRRGEGSLWRLCP